MSKNSVSGSLDKNQNGLVPNCNTRTRNTTEEYQGGSVLSLCSADRSRRSSRCKELAKGVDIVRGLLAGGQAVDELSLYDLLPKENGARYAKGYSLSCLRVVNRLFRNDTRLFLENGLWIIAPVSREVQQP